MRPPVTVVASVGTYHHPFDRFVSWLEPWTRRRSARVVFQHGSTRPIAGADNHEMLDPAALLEHYRAADVVVLQGGAGGFMDARQAGRIPIVVPRVPVGDEVVDDHQLVLSRRLAAMGLVHVAETREDLDRLLDGVLDGTVPTRLETDGPTDGVTETVRLLSRPLEAQRRIDLDDVPRPAADTRPLGEQYLRARDDRGRRGGASALAAGLRQGVLGYALALAATAIVLGVLDAARSASVVALVVTAVWLVHSFCAQPPYERAWSWLAARRGLVLIGLVTLVHQLSGATSPPDARSATYAGLAGVGVQAACAAVHRRLLRRTRTILVGDRPRVAALRHRWRHQRDVRVVASCVWSPGSERIPAGTAGSLDQVVPEVLAAVTRHRARRVVVTSEAALSTAALRHLAWATERDGVQCVVLADLDDHVEHLRPQQLGGQLVLGIRPPHHLVSRALKTVLERVLALSALVVLSPLLLLIGVLVRLDSTGPAVFRQTRTGLDGRPFTMLKFRTMEVGAEERLRELSGDDGAGPLFKLADDPRVTRIGRVLRRTSLDELPQLLNVVGGSMSLVGPRPALPAETAEYDEWTWRRLHVRPGLTGLWQVSGRSRLSWEESIRLDLLYVNTWTLGLDVRILLRTVRAVLLRDGAL